MRRGGAVLVLLALLLAGCTGPPRARFVGPASPSPGGSAPSGLVALGDDGTGYQLIGFDPRTGTRTGTFGIPWRSYDPGGQGQLRTGVLNGSTVVISADRTSLATVTLDGSISLARLSGGSYQLGRLFAPAVSGPGRFADPRFGRDGRLRFSLITGSSGDSSPTSVFSVDPHDPASQPRDEHTTVTDRDSTGDPGQPVTLPVQGLPDIVFHDENGERQRVQIRATLSRTDSELLGGWIGGPDPQSRNERHVYDCGPIDGHALLCLVMGYGESGQNYGVPGAVVVLTLAGDRRSVVLRRLVPDGDNELGQVSVGYPAPDHRQVLLKTGHGWYLGPLDGSEAPHRVLTGQAAPDASLVLGWY